MTPTELETSGWQVPTYRDESLAPRSTRYCVAVFVIDEGDRLLAQLSRMQPYMQHADVIIADGGSMDGSTEITRLRDLRVRALLVKEGPGRLGAQMRMAFAYAMKEGYEGVITIDGNGKDGVSAIPAFVEALDQGLDHVQGSRYIKGGVAVRTPFLRHWGVKLLHAPLISVAAGLRYTDTTNGFRAYSKRFLLDRRVAPFRSIFSGYELHYYLAIRAARLGYSVKELPVSRAYPAEGRTPTKIRGLRGNLGILRTLLYACTGRYKPGEGKNRG